MKMIVAVIRPEKLSDVANAMEAAGIKAMTVTSTKGRGVMEVIPQMGQEYDLDLLDKTRLDIVVTDDMVDMVIDTIATSAQTGERGDGKIFVLPVETVVKIRTGTDREKAI